MNISKKRLLPILLATCIGAGTVSTCDASWGKSLIENLFITDIVLGVFRSLIKKIPNKTVRYAASGLYLSFVVGYSVCKIYDICKKYTLNIINLEAACKKGDYNKVKAILDKNKDDKRMDYYIKDGCLKESCLYLACKYGDLKLVRLLIDRLTDKKLVSDYLSGSILEGALQNTGKNEKGVSLSIEIFELLVKEFYKDLNYSSIENTHILSPIHIACKYKRLDLVRWLVETEEIDVNLRREYDGLKFNVTPLDIAFESGDLEIVKYLISNKANVKANKTLLEVAIESENQNFEIIKYLLERKKQSDIENKPEVNTIHNIVKIEKKEIKFKRVFDFRKGSEVTDLNDKFKALGLGCKSNKVESLTDQKKEKFTHEFTVTI